MDDTVDQFFAVKSHPAFGLGIHTRTGSWLVHFERNENETARHWKNEDENENENENNGHNRSAWLHACMVPF